MLTEVDDDDLGPVLQHNVMWRMSETPGRIRFTGRALGADTDAVLAELGYRRRRDPAACASEGADPMTDALLDAVAGGVGVVDLGRQLPRRHAAVAQPPAVLARAAAPARRHGPRRRRLAPPTT